VLCCPMGAHRAKVPGRAGVVAQVGHRGKRVVAVVACVKNYGRINVFIFNTSKMPWSLADI